MRIKFSSYCWKCFRETDQTQESYQKIKEGNNGENEVLVELNDENLYSFTCSKGHINYTQLQEQKFEILFDLGALALLDGYSKEAVSTMSSSYERFIEFCIKVICISKSVSQKEYLKTWKTMVKQSERQLGAFNVLQLLEFGETKYILHDDWINFRNKVIHQGLIPKTEQAIEYGEKILAIVYPLLQELNSKYPESIKEATFLRITENGDKVGDNYSISTGSMPTIIDLRSINSESFGLSSFKESLESIKANGFYKSFYVKE